MPNGSNCPSIHFLTMCWLVLAASPAWSDPAFDVLVQSYRETLSGYDAQDLIWKDGTRLPRSDGRSGKTFEELLARPSIADQFAIRYRLGKPLRTPALDEDPGRLRNEAFFAKMYGDCRKGEVQGKLRPVNWLPNRGGRTIMATQINGIAAKLEMISAELEKMPESITKFAAPSAGAYNCRKIAASNLVSMHSYGAAIDLNASSGDYWLWTKKGEGELVWRNRVPYPIVEIFERYGFIWGGKWYHFDTFHFEYRPEIIEMARRGWPGRAE